MALVWDGLSRLLAKLLLNLAWHLLIMSATIPTVMARDTGTPETWELIILWYVSRLFFSNDEERLRACTRQNFVIFAPILAPMTVIPNGFPARTFQHEAVDKKKKKEKKN